MKPKDIFKLAVQLLGLAFVYHGLTTLPVMVTAIYTALTGAHLVSFILTILMAIWPLAVAYWLLSGAPLLMRIAYPDSNETLREQGLCAPKVDS